MISLSSARRLKEAGLAWSPALHDFFAIPDRGLDERVFVISDMAVNLEGLQGEPIVTFQGVLEWALDYVVSAEAVWLPTEAQLREALERRTQTEPEPALWLVSSPDQHRCEIHVRGQPLAFEHADASEAYAAALLYLLKDSGPTPHKGHIPGPVSD